MVGRPSAAMLLLGLMLSAGFVAPLAMAEPGIDTSKPYASGFVTFSSYLGGWYAWVNEAGVKLVFLALHSSVYNSPVFAVVGQEYNATGGNPVFTGDALMFMEVLNGTELKYVATVNSSQSFQATPVSQDEAGGVLKLHWGVEYEGIDAFLESPSAGCAGCYGGGTVAARVLLDHLGMSYDYTITNETTTLQSRYDVGNFTLEPPLGSTNSTVTSLDGLGLSLVFSTVTIASKDYSVNTNSTGQGAAGLTGASIQVGDLKAFQYLFNDNYTLYRPQPALYSAEFSSVSPSSIPSSFGSPNVSPLGWIPAFQQSLPMFSGLAGSQELYYSQSKFLYSLSFPQWSGHALAEDPTFIAYLGGEIGGTHPTSTSGAIAIPSTLVAAVAVSGVVLTDIALMDAARRRRLSSEGAAVQIKEHATGSLLQESPS